MAKVESILAKDIMNEGVRAVEKSTKIRDVAKIMDKERIGSVVVLDKNKPVGITTERDFAVKLAAKNYSVEKNVSEIMSSPVFYVTPFQTITEVIQLMAKKNIRRIPVIRDDIPIGIVTATDLVRLFSSCSGEEIKEIYEQFIKRIFS